MMSARISTENAGLVRVTVTGEADMATADELSRTLTAAIERNGVRRIVVDLAGLAFCDSAGLAALDEGYAVARDRGIALRVSDPRPGVRRILEITGMLDALTQG
jgi:anti-sigma B factor antagonist